jgi:hypothetical protein
MTKDPSRGASPKAGPTQGLVVVDEVCDDGIAVDVDLGLRQTLGDRSNIVWFSSIP